MKTKSFIKISIIIILILFIYFIPSVSADINFYGNETASEEEQKLMQNEKELQDKLKSAQEECDELEQKTARSSDEEKKLKRAKQNVRIFSNGLKQIKKNREIISAQNRINKAEQQLAAVNWFIKNEQNPEKLKELNKEKETLERTITQANDVYSKLKYPPVDWNAFGGEMVAGFISGKFYDEFQGLAKLGSMFLSEEEMERTSRNLRRLFCDYIPLPTTQCLTSKVCARFPDHLKRDRIVVTRTASNQMQSSAHVEGTKSPPIITEDKTETLYTATFALYNNQDTTIDYKIELTGPGETHLWETGQVSVGQIISSSKTEPLIDYLIKDYTDVCLVLNPGVKDYRGKRRSRLCSPLILKSNFLLETYINQKYPYIIYISGLYYRVY